jgi:hypothetical protein
LRARLNDALHRSGCLREGAASWRVERRQHAGERCYEDTPTMTQAAPRYAMPPSRW